MKRIIITLSVTGSIFLFSCQKEVDFANGNSGGGTTSGTLLIKMATKFGPDSLVQEFIYNSSK